MVSQSGALNLVSCPSLLPTAVPPLLLLLPFLGGVAADLAAGRSLLRDAMQKQLVSQEMLHRRLLDSDI